MTELIQGLKDLTIITDGIIIPGRRWTNLESLKFWHLVTIRSKVNGNDSFVRQKLELPTSSLSIHYFFVFFETKLQTKFSSCQFALGTWTFFLILGYCHQPMPATLNQCNIKMNFVMITGFRWVSPMQPIGYRCYILDFESSAWELIEFRVLSSKNCSFNSWIQPKSVLEYQKCSTPEARTLNSSKVSKPG